MSYRNDGEQQVAAGCFVLATLLGWAMLATVGAVAFGLLWWFK